MKDWTILRLFGLLSMQDVTDWNLHPTKFPSTRRTSGAWQRGVKYMYVLSMKFEPYLKIPISFRMEIVGPSFRLDNIADIAEGVHHLRIRKPRPSEDSGSPRARNGAMHEDETAVLFVVGSGMRCDDGHRIPGDHMYLAVLHSIWASNIKPFFSKRIITKDEINGYYQVDRFATSKDKINGALDVAIFVQMSPLVIEEGVLKSVEFAVIENRGIPA